MFPAHTNGLKIISNLEYAVIMRMWGLQILIKSIQHHTLDAIEVIDRISGKYMKPSYALLTS